MKKKQIIAVALIVSAIASVAAYRLIRKKMKEDEENDTDEDGQPVQKKRSKLKNFFQRSKENQDASVATN